MSPRQVTVSQEDGVKAEVFSGPPGLGRAELSPSFFFCLCLYLCLAVSGQMPPGPAGLQVPVGPCAISLGLQLAGGRSSPEGGLQEDKCRASAPLLGLRRLVLQGGVGLSEAPLGVRTAVDPRCLWLLCCCLCKSA